MVDPRLASSNKGLGLPTFTISPGDSDGGPPGISTAFGVSATRSLLDGSDVDLLSMAGLLTKIIQAICTTIGAQGIKAHASHTMRRIISIICKLKPDAPLDLLEVVATGHQYSRAVALEVLHAKCPKTMGHNVIARRIPVASRVVDVATKKLDSSHKNGTPQHHYVAWRISSHDSIKDPHNRCLVCETEIHGFCVRCVMCSDQCHLHCLRTSTETFTYEIIHLSHTGASHPKTVHVKYSQVPISPLGSTDTSRKTVGSHHLRLVNLFTATNCAACQLPIWGAYAQAFACITGCQRMYHPICTTALVGTAATECRPGQNIMINEFQSRSHDPFQIDSIQLRRSFETEKTRLCRSDDDLAHTTFDEIAVLYGALWTQYKIFESGIAAGTIVVADEAGQIDLLGLRQYLKRYESFLKSNITKASTAATDFANVAGAERPLAQGYVFSRQYITYCTALLRTSPSVGPSQGGHTFLNPFDRTEEPTLEHPAGAMEMLPLSLIRSGLANDLSLHDPAIASMFLDQLNALGLCVTHDQINSHHDPPIERWGHFPLPLLMDATPSVEILIVAIQVLLDDLDLSFNEQALILLINRAWPTLLCSPYALERLGGAVISWVMNEVSLRQ